MTDVPFIEVVYENETTGQVMNFRVPELTASWHKYVLDTFRWDPECVRVWVIEPGKSPMDIGSYLRNQEVEG